MDISKLRKNWEGFAQSDPMWAILTVPGKEGRRWNQDEFFQSGRIEISKVLSAAKSFGFSYDPGVALDFGCGLGRLTQALCEHFDQCYGVDIAPTMIKEAIRLNRHDGRCTYIQNEQPDLRIFENDFFDFIYSNIVLQHMRPEYSRAYLREFLRILKPGGLTVFQLAAERCRPVTATPAALPSVAFCACLSSRSTLLRVRPLEELAVQVEARNASPENWPALGNPDGTYRLFVGNHWYYNNGQLLQFDDGRAILPHDVRPGEQFAVEVKCRAPRRRGKYVLEFDIGQERVTWFKNYGSPTLTVEVIVEGKPDSAAIASLPLSVRYPTLQKAALRLHLLPWLRRLKKQPETAAIESDKPVMEVYGNLPADVTAWIQTCGGKVLLVEDDEHAKPDWFGNRYWVTKPAER